jgi:DNA-binding winged helix-turn-helix (wHTH) protein/tetratricopeptide (TPR) repeat protein
LVLKLSDLAHRADFSVGPLLVSPSRRTVQGPAGQAQIEPLIMQLFLVLLDARGEVVTRSELFERCWGGAMVGDDSLNRAITMVRRIAAQTGPGLFEIENIPRTGYRLVGEILSTGKEELEAPPAPGAGEERKTRKAWRLPAIGIAALAVTALAALLLARLESWPWQAGPLTVLVAPASPDEESRALAQDVAAKLGSLQSSGSMRLIGQAQGSSGDADLIFRIRRIDGGRAKAGALLVHAPKAAILWSRDFAQPSGNIADLQQQVAVTAARVIGCAIEGLESPDRLSRADLKTYLDACALLDNAVWELPGIVQSLQGVVERSPRFARGWAKLLAAESTVVMVPALERYAPAARPPLERHIAAARRVQPDLPEAYLAQYALAPLRDFTRRGLLLKEAVRRNPNHAGLRAERAAFLGSTGRMYDNVLQMREAVRLDPLSPGLRDSYVSALLYSGDVEAALAQVREAERLWPGASSVLMARYRIHLRYGDPHMALRMIRSRTVESPATPLQESFLLARIDPSPKNVERAIRLARAKEQETALAIDNYAQALAQFGRTDELLEILLTRPPSRLVGDIIFRPAFRELHKDPRFMRVVHRIGLVDYWRSSGDWPDFCFAADLPYDCKAEAAKLQPR